MAYVDHISVDGVQYDIRDAEAVSFEQEQTLNDVQQEQARANIGAGSEADVADLKSQTDGLDIVVNGSTGGAEDITSTVTWTSGKSVNADNGNLFTNANYSYADIPLLNATHVAGYTRAGLNYLQGLCFLTAGGQWISGDYHNGASSYDWNYSFDIPQNAAILRISCATSYVSSFTCTLTIPASDGLETRVSALETSTAVDTTLSIAGRPADAKAVGDKFNDLKIGNVVTYTGRYTQLREGDFKQGTHWRLKLVSSTASADYVTITALTDKTDTSTAEQQFNLYKNTEQLWSPLKNYEAIRYAVNGSCTLEINDCSSIYDQIQNVFYCGANRQYTKLIDAIAAAELYMDSILYVDAGVYDLVSELGADYFAGISSTTTMAGIVLKNRIHIIFSPNAFITCHYTGDNEYALKNFAPFVAGEYGFILENMNLDSSRTRYAIHDERNGKSEQCISKYINCNIKQDNSENEEWTSYCCIGGGLGSNHEIDIENCIFESVAADGTTVHGTVSYHPSNNSSNHDFACKLIVKDSYFITGTVELAGARSDATHDTMVIFTNNSVMYNAANAANGLYFGGSASYPGTHYVIKAWSNEIRQ